MPVWLQNEGAWIAIGVSVLFVLAGFVMHRVVMKVLKTPPSDPTGASSEAHLSEQSKHEHQQP
ncbi:hypothetical protein [Hydrogenophaga sp. 5NK40-0174]|uniref:hypothetical protein n=1 Tax=Hydrogenophaga sp. 5NK40-0174 TaxID=3127649 RepID=UPI003340887F